MFNNLVFYKDNTYFLFNTLTNNYLIINSLIKDLIEAGISLGDIEDLAEIHPSLYASLIENEFLVNNDKDEVQAVVGIREEIDLDPEDLEYQVVINPTMNCNFKCWYCYESHIKDSRLESQELENIKRFITNTIEQKPNLKKFRVSWFGGEPLLQYKQVVEPIQLFCKELFATNGIEFTSSFTTNGFLINDEMIEVFANTNVKGFQITLDGHRELHDKVRYVSSSRGSYDQIVANILKLCRKGLFVNLRINYTRETLLNITDILPDLEDLELSYRDNLLISFRKVWQEDDPTVIDRALTVAQIFRDFKFNVSKSGYPDTLNQSCYADKRNQATINYNGDIYKCTARDFKASGREGKLNDRGLIEWNERLDQRLQVKFRNKPCLSCPILPMCNGGCSQKALENSGKDYCVFNFNELDKKKVVLEKILMNLNTADVAV